MEKKLLELLNYDVLVDRTTYTKVYFDLRVLSGGDMSLPPLSRDDAEMLEARGAHVNTQLIDVKERWAAKTGWYGYVHGISIVHSFPYLAPYLSRYACLSRLYARPQATQTKAS
jgi:hypothetical protein